MNNLKERVKTNIKAIREVLDDNIEPDDLLSVQHKLNQCINICGLAAETKAGANELLHLSRFKAVDEGRVNMKLPASVLKQAIDGSCHEEIGIYTEADRLNAFLSHSIDGLRSMLSMIKAQLEKGI